jgi:hypothetical protein
MKIVSISAAPLGCFAANPANQSWKVVLLVFAGACQLFYLMPPELWSEESPQETSYEKSEIHVDGSC